ncbi:Hypothetical protein A7982_01091 [Minicystis rosea]|nr:Hypothetical protein A7982_01091 [Minicystis rosea]
MSIGVGAPGACDDIVLSGMPIAYDAEISAPILATEDGLLVSVLRQEDQGIVASTFEPWGAWPTSAPPSFTACASCMGGSRVASPAMPEARFRRPRAT